MKSALLIAALVLVFFAACTTTTTAPMQSTNDHMGNHMGDHGSHMVSSEEEFVVEMIPHHQEAVDTSLLVLESTQNEELAQLAEEIVEAQEQEIAMMRGWLDEYYEGGYEPSYEPMMGDLESLSGEERDVAYIQGMIMHHMGAVMMARSVLALDPSSHVESFANEVIEAQTTEIAQLRSMLAGYE